MIRIIPKDKVRDRVIENTAHKIEVFSNALALERDPSRIKYLENKLEQAKIRHYGFFASN